MVEKFRVGVTMGAPDDCDGLNGLSIELNGFIVTDWSQIAPINIH
ncbi:hypothetical protein ACVC7V_23925 [Hydrogenophaga sp. A37]|nr:hypothetical protein [Hydrogenophaga sp. A37]